MRAKGLKVTLGVAAIGLCSLILSPIAKADPAPGEGAYLGAFVGFGSGMIQAKVERLEGGTASNDDANTYEIKNGGLGLSGIQGGGYGGWGLKTADDLYFGFEIGKTAIKEVKFLPF